MGLIVDAQKIFSIIKFSRLAFGQYKWQILILTGLGFLSGIFEGIGINSLIPLFSFMTGKASEQADTISQIIKSLFLFFHITFSVNYLLIFIALLFIFKALTLLIFSYLSTKIVLGYEQNTRNRLLSNFLKSDWTYLLEQKLGYLEKILMVNVRTSSQLLSHISNTTMIIASLLVYITVAINISWQLTLATLFIGSLVILFFRPFIYKVRGLSTIEENLNRKIAHHINENILGMKTVKIMAVDDKVVNIAKDYFNQVKKVQLRAGIFSMVSSVLMQPISILFILSVFAIYYRNSNLNLAAFVAIIYLIKQMFNYFDQLQKNLVSINATSPFLKIILEQEQKSVSSREDEGGKMNFQFNDFFAFENVSFSYENEKDILSNISFKIKKGELVGLIGPSGGGKTTSVDLILRLFKPTSGLLTIDGINIEKINLDEWRKNIGYISQDMFLMNDTILNNIKFYKDEMTMDDVIEAAKMGNIYDFIQSCPQKFDTKIGDRGITLSNGQRQRIIIARVLARKPKFLIMDEATSALDNESEMEIQKVIRSIKGRVTVLLIAHRLSTIVNSDRLLVLENGKIVEQGEPENLLKDKESYFFKVYNLRN